MIEYGRQRDVLVRSALVDVCDETPYMFAAVCELLRLRADVLAVVLPDLTYVAHIASVAGLGRAGLARYLSAAVLLATPTPDPTPPPPPSGPAVSDGQPPAATGPIQHAPGTPAVDRTWTRALLIRHAHDHGLRLLDIIETTDDVHALLSHLGQSAAATGARTLLTDEVPGDLAQHPADDLALRHRSVVQPSDPG